MAFTSNSQLFVSVLLIALFSFVAGHSYMTSPISRSNQAQTQSGCRGPSCLGPCDVPLSRATRTPIAAVRGASIRVEWPRNNHAGGFIRFAWAPTSLSDSHAAFDAHVQMITCHEIGNPTPNQCAPADPVNDPNGGGSGPGDGSFGACNTMITVPLDLADGQWTLQWAWFGGAFSLGDYYSCTDFVVTGGPVGIMTPVFRGGDYSRPNQQVCKFFNTDKLHICNEEPCQRPLYAAGARYGAPALGQLGLNISSNVPFPSVPSPNNNVPSTTGSVSTTSMAAPVPVPATPVPVPATPVPSVPAPTPVPVPVTPVPSVPAPVPAPVTPAPSVPVPSSSVGSNCAAATSVSSSTARFTSIDSWGSSFHALIEIDVAEAILSNWVLEISFPMNTQIDRSFNGGVLTCTRSSITNMVAYYRPSAFWANNMSQGSKIQVEFIAGSGGKSADYIRSNTVLRVLKQ